jgi:MFS family permease
MKRASRDPLGTRPSYRWWVVFMLWFVCFFNYADRQAIFSVFPLVERELGLTKFQLGIVGSAFMWVYAALAPVAGFTGDRASRKLIILGGFSFWSAITVLTGRAGRFAELVALRALEGFGEAFYFPASMSLVSDYHGPRTRSRAMSLHQSSVYIGTIGGGALGGYFGQYYGWRAGFYVFGLSGFVLSIVLLRFLREPVRGESEAAPAAGEDARPPGVREVLGEVFRTPTALVLLAVFCGANFVAAMFLTWTPSFLREKFHMNLAMAGLTATVYIQLASAAGSPFGGFLADRLARRLPAGRMLTQMIGLTLGAPFIWITARTESVAHLVGAMACFGFFKGMYDANIFASAYDVVHPRARATAAGIMNAVGWTGGALAPVAIGWLLHRAETADAAETMSTALSLGATVYLTAASLLLWGIAAFVRRDTARLRRRLDAAVET